MYKTLLTVVISLWALTSGFGQMQLGSSTGSITGRISGILIDSVTQKPVSYASIGLNKIGESKILNGSVSNDDGTFKIEGVTPGRYVLSVSFVGYRDKIVDTVRTTPSKPDQYLGRIFMASNDVTLGEVTVEAQSSLIENKVDRIVYNAEKDLTSVGGDATEVLKKVPMITVDLEGKVQLRGSDNVRVLINNKPSGIMANSVADALKMIPADQIKSIEVITSPGAKYDAEGTAGIINIITKKKDIEGLNGTVSANAGSRQVGGNASINYRKSRLGLTANLNGNYNFPRNGYTNFSRTDYADGNERLLTQNGIFRGSRNFESAGVGLDYDFNAYNNITSNVRLSTMGFRGENDLNASYTAPADSIFQQYQRISDNKTQWTTVDWSTDFRRTFKKPQKEWTTGFQVSSSQSNNNYTSEFNGVIDGVSEKSRNPGSNTEVTLQTDLVLPLGTKWTYEGGAKGILRFINSEYNYDILQNGAYINDPSRYNKFSYNQNVAAAYSQVSVKLDGGYEIKGGLRAEGTTINGEFKEEQPAVKDDYLNVLPSLTAAKTFKNFSSLKFGYSRRIQRPSMWYLNPYTNASDPKNITYGNPNLTPELTDALELSYNTFFSGTSITANVFYRVTNNAILNTVDVTPQGVTVTTFENIGHNQAYGVSLFGSWQIIKQWALRGGINVFNIQQRGVLKGVELENSSIQYNINLMSSFTFKNGWSAEGFGSFNSPRLTLQGKNPSFTISSFGVKKEFWNKKGSLTLSIINPFNEYLKFKSEFKGSDFNQVNESGIPLRSFLLTFSYQFGKMDFSSQMKRFGKKGVKNDDLKEGENSGGGF